MADIPRFHSPFSRWRSGLLTELAVFAAFLLVLAVLAGLVAEVL